MAVLKHDYGRILALILEQYQLPLDGEHGVHHWARVWTNGHAVGEKLVLTWRSFRTLLSFMTLAAKTNLTTRGMGYGARDWR